jgi:hypothetical protein
LNIIQVGQKLLTTFQTYINRKVLEISGNGLNYSKEPLKIARAIVALLQRTQMTEAKRQFSPEKANLSVVVPEDKISYSSAKDVTIVTIRNMETKHLEDSPSSHGWNNFRRQLVSYIRRAQEGLQKAVKQMRRLVKFFSAACRWHTFNQTFSFNKMFASTLGSYNEKASE